MRLYRTAIKRPVTIFMIFVSLVVLGAVSLVKLPLEFMPGIDLPFLYVWTPYRDSLPTQIEKEITKPLEEVLATLPSVVRMESGSGTDFCYVGVEFEWGVNLDVMRLEVREKIDQIRAELPEDLEKVFIFTFNFNDAPIMVGRISAHGKDLMGSYDLLEKKVINPLQRIEGVARVQIDGVLPARIDVYLEEDKIKDHAVDVGALFRQLQGANLDLSVGKVTEGGKRFNLRTMGGFRSLEEIETLPVRADGLKLGDIARIEYATPELTYGRYLNGQPAVAFWVQKESGHNVVEVAHRVSEELERINEDPALAGIETVIFFDQSRNIINSLEGLRSSGMWGALLAVLVLYFFLRRFVPTLVVSLAIPLSVISTCSFLYLSGRSLNILTMMGLMLGVGMLVDNAVVVIESIFRRHMDGMRGIRAALVGTREVATAIVAATATSVIVFAPVVLAAGQNAFTTFLAPVGITISVALILSLFVSLTLIPLLSSRFLRRPSGPPRVPLRRLRGRISRAYWGLRERRYRWWTGKLPFLSRWMQDPARVRGLPLVERETLRYLHWLKWTSQKRPVLAGLVILPLAMVATLMAAQATGLFSMDMEEAELHESLYISYDFSDNMNYRATRKYVERVEEEVSSHKKDLGVKTIYSYYTDNGAGTTLFFEHEYLTMDRLREKRRAVREILPEMAGVRLVMGEDHGGGGPGSGTGGGGGGGSVTVELNLFGEDRELLTVIAREVSRRLSRLEGLEDVRPDLREGKEEVHIVVDRDRASAYGVTPGSVASVLNLTYRGVPLPKFRGKEREVDVNLSLQPKDRSELEGLRDLTVSMEEGRELVLGSVASFRRGEGPGEIYRVDQKSTVRVAGSYEGESQDQLFRGIRGIMSQIPLPTGYSWSFGRDIQRTNRQGQAALFNILLAFCCVFMVMAALFENLWHPLVIMACVPFASVGVVWTFIFTHTPMTLMAVIGLVILIGIVVNNGIVLVDHINNFRRAGRPIPEAILEAGRERFRPILMTAFTTVLGLLPMALGQANLGGTTYYPLARAIIGGLISSTVLTLVFLPAYYVMVERLQHTLAGFFARAGRPLPRRVRLPGLRLLTRRRSR
jgi:HAE1 family hydrophobic/amphiphilic exporter-1